MAKRLISAVVLVASWSTATVRKSILGIAFAVYLACQEPGRVASGGQLRHRLLSHCAGTKPIRTWLSRFESVREFGHYSVFGHFLNFLSVAFDEIRISDPRSQINSTFALKRFLVGEEC
jgi:hypothetical protein